MNERVKQHLTKFAESKGWDLGEGKEIIEILECGKRVWEGDRETHRWWDEVDYVVEIDGMFIKYIYAEANRDESVSELGWEFDESSIHEVQPKEITTIVYESIK